MFTIERSKTRGSRMVVIKRIEKDMSEKYSTNLNAVFTMLVSRKMYY